MEFKVMASKELADDTTAGPIDTKTVLQSADELAESLKETFKMFDRFEQLSKEINASMVNMFKSMMTPAITEDVEHLLDEVNFEGVARYMKSDRCQHIVTIAGAGISTSAGIPDFRTPGSGLYDNLQKYNLPSPTAIFQLDYFKENPEPFWKVRKALWSGNYKPTLCHYFIKLLNDKGKLLRHFTQNIDGLEFDTGMAADQIVQAHGTMRTAHCLKCQAEYSQEWMKERILVEDVPYCTVEACKGSIKPDTVFFGERLPSTFFTRVDEDLSKCDLLLIMGTSLSVQPFASLPSKVPASCPRLYINLDMANAEKIPAVDPMMQMLTGAAKMDFTSERNYRDVFKQSSCDDGCRELAKLLGWGNDLQRTSTNNKIKEPFSKPLIDVRPKIKDPVSKPLIDVRPKSMKKTNSKGVRISRTPKSAKIVKQKAI